MSEDISEYDAQVKLALEKRSQTYVTALAKASDEITALRAELAETKAALEKADAYAITLQRAIEALAHGHQLPPKELSPHILGLAGTVIDKLAAAERRAQDALEIARRSAHELTNQWLEANACALAAEEYARKAEQFATAKADEHCRGVAQAARAEALEEAAKVVESMGAGDAVTIITDAIRALARTAPQEGTK